MLLASLFQGDLETLEQRRAEVGAAVDGVCQLQNSEGHVFTQVASSSLDSTHDPKDQGDCPDHDPPGDGPDHGRQAAALPRGPAAPG